MIPCNNCKTAAEEEIEICAICNYPIKGTEKEKASFIAKQVIQKSDVEESIKRLKTSRIILFVIGAFYLIISLKSFINVNTSFSWIFNLVLGLIFIGFAFLTYKKPIIAIGVPLGLTLLYYLTLLLIDPTYLWSGILWKMIIVMGLGYGFFSVRKSNDILKKNKYLATLLGFNEIK